MSNIPYTEIKKLMDDFSSSFCAAKWYNVSIWLGNGKTASCHHPLAHPIPLDELSSNPSALHNTNFKKERRKEMLEGVRPKECSYCWRVEDAAKDSPNIFSDRMYQTSRYTKEDIEKIKTMPWDVNVSPKTIEICFDNLCNLACSYCNSEFSSTWSKDILNNGEYEGMKTNGGLTYKSDGSIAMPFGNKNEDNIYVNNFFNWFEEIRDELMELRVSGGEPSRSPSFWKLLDVCNNDKFDFAVNSNLIMDDERLYRLLNSSDKFKSLDIYTSAECFGKHQEFVRDGFKWDLWKDNMFKVEKSKKVRRLNIMMTISVLSIWTVDLFLDEIVKWRKELNNIHTFSMSVNILRFPSFQSINMIDQNIKNILADNIESSVIVNRPWMEEWEVNHFDRLVLYLRQVDISYEDNDSTENKINDLKKFVNQYSIRRNKPIDEYMPIEFIDWFKTL